MRLNEFRIDMSEFPIARTQKRTNSIVTNVVFRNELTIDQGLIHLRKAIEIKKMLRIDFKISCDNQQFLFRVQKVFQSIYIIKSVVHRQARYIFSGPSCDKISLNSEDMVKIRTFYEQPKAAPGCTRLHQTAPGCTKFLYFYIRRSFPSHFL